MIAAAVDRREIITIYVAIVNKILDIFIYSLFTYSLFTMKWTLQYYCRQSLFDLINDQINVTIIETTFYRNINSYLWLLGFFGKSLKKKHKK